MSNVTAAGVTPALKSSVKPPSTDELIAQLEASIVRADTSISSHTSELKRSLVAQAGKLAVGGVVAAAVTGLLIWRPWQGRHAKAVIRRQKRRAERHLSAGYDHYEHDGRSKSRPLFASARKTACRRSSA